MRKSFAVSVSITACSVVNAADGISAKEIQRQPGRKHYQPVWEMVHKLRDVMGKRDSCYVLYGDVEIDEGFFSTETPEEQKYRADFKHRIY